VRAAIVPQELARLLQRLFYFIAHETAALETPSSNPDTLKIELKDFINPQKQKIGTQRMSRHCLCIPLCLSVSHSIYLLVINQLTEAYSPVQ